jgi:Tol biopolymer transport system component
MSVSAKGTLCFGSAGDIYCSPFDGREHGSPERLPSTVNTSSREGQPFIAPDERYLIFSSNGYPDGVGDYDLYISVRDADDSWSRAINLGEGVNSPYQELCPVVSRDGQHLFFLSSRGGSHSVYWVDATSIEPLKEQRPAP